MSQLRGAELPHQPRWLRALAARKQATACFTLSIPRELGAVSIIDTLRQSRHNVVRGRIVDLLAVLLSIWEFLPPPISLMLI